jgi:hypothetical protein
MGLSFCFSRFPDSPFSKAGFKVFTLVSREGQVRLGRPILKLGQP